MMKLGIAAALALAIGGAGYAVTRSDARTAGTAAATTTTTAAETASPTRAAVASTTRGTIARTAAGMHPSTSTSTSTTPDCDGVAQHVADLALESQPDAATLTPEQGAAAVHPVLVHVQGACESMQWSADYRACVLAADSMFGVAVGCAKLQPAETPAGVLPGHGGMIKIPDSATPIAPYTGSDLSCASVARHLVLFSTPDPDGLAKLPADQRTKVEEGIARMHKTMPDQIDAACTQGAWPEAKRQCLLATTTFDAAQKCM